MKSCLRRLSLICNSELPPSLQALGEIQLDNIDECRSPDSWLWTDHSQISLAHLPTPPICSTRAIMALINNLGIVYHQYCSSSYLYYICANPGPLYRSQQWKSSSNLILTRLPELQLQSWLHTDLDESPKAPSNLNSPLPMQSL